MAFNSIVAFHRGIILPKIQERISFVSKVVALRISFVSKSNNYLLKQILLCTSCTSYVIEPLFVLTNHPTPWRINTSITITQTSTMKLLLLSAAAALIASVAHAQEYNIRGSSDVREEKLIYYYYHYYLLLSLVLLLRTMYTSCELTYLLS